MNSNIDILKNLTGELLQRDEEAKHNSKYFNTIIDIQQILIENGGKSLSKLLSVLGNVMEVDRTYIYRNQTTEFKVVSVIEREWSANGIISHLQDHNAIPVDFAESPQLTAALIEDGIYNIPDTTDIEDTIKDIAEGHHAKSILAVPLFIKDYFYGFLGVDMCVEMRNWNTRDEILLKTVAYSISMYLYGKSTESRLKHSTKMFGHTIFGIVITDTNGDIEYANELFCKMYGYNESELIGRNMRFFKSGKHDDQFYKDMWDTVQSGEIFSDFIYNKHKNGRIYKEKTTITPVKYRSDNGEDIIINFIAIKEPINGE